MPRTRISNSAALIFAAALLLGVVPRPLGAVYRQPSQSDRDYLLHGSRFPAVCWIEEPGATGTLIAPTWVLTAAHYMSEGRPRSGDAVRFGDRAYSIKQVIVHREYPGRPGADLALLELSEPVSGIKPLEVYAGRAQLQQHVTLVGFGRTDIVKKGAPFASDSEEFVPLKRAGTNTISRIADDLIVTRITPSTALVGPTQDAALGIGDSGGPLLVDSGGRLAIVGVISGYSLGTENDFLGRQNSEDQFVRVSQFAEWIEDTAGRSSGAQRVEKSILWLLILAIVSFVVAAVFRRRWKRGIKVVAVGRRD